MGTPSGKRPIQYVDVSLDEVHEVGPSAPPKYPRISGQRFGQDTTFVPLTHASHVSLDDEEDAEAADLIPATQDGGDADSAQLHYGDVNTKIVGVRYYRGQATIGEHVVLKREPRNQYDRNAIRVDNVMGAQIGHIPRNMAAKLAGYMVSVSITEDQLSRA
jgi:SWI/SNF-related matrix-associated actin-dependent regulator of chromatin subfamily A3